MAAPIFQGGTGNQSIVTAGTTIVIDFPATPVNNDILLVPLTCGSGGPITPPAGEAWEVVDYVDMPGVFSCYLFWKRFLTGMSNVESGAFTAPNRTGTAILGSRCFFVRGCVTTGTPFYLGNKISGTGTTVTGLSVDIVGNYADTLALVAGGKDLNITATTPVDWTENFDGGTGTGDDAGWYMATKAPSANGIMAGPDLTLSAAAATAFFMLALSSVTPTAGTPPATFDRRMGMVL